MNPYQFKALAVLTILFLYFFYKMCRAYTGTTQELAYGMLAIFTVFIAMGVIQLC